MGAVSDGTVNKHKRRKEGIMNKLNGFLGSKCKSCKRMCCSNDCEISVTCMCCIYVQSRRIRVATSDTNGKNLPVADKGGLCCCCSPINEEVNRKHIKLTNFATPLN